MKYPRVLRLLAFSAAIVISSVTVVASAPAAPASAATVAADETTSLAIINGNRKARGLAKLASTPELSAFAHQWAKEYGSAAVLDQDGPAMAVLPRDGKTGDAPVIVSSRNTIGGDLSFTFFTRAETAVRTVTHDTVWRKSGFSHGAVGIYQPTRNRMFVVLVLANYPGCVPSEMKPVTPVIGGTTASGGTMVAGTGNWVPGSSTVKYSYEWRINNEVVGREKTFIPSNDHAGEQVDVLVEATRACYRTPLTRLSAPRTIYPNDAPIVTGDRNVGETLAVDTSTFGADGSTYTYQWRRNSVVIPGATNATYEQTDADRTAIISVTVVATMGGTVLTETTARGPITRGSLFESAPDATITGTPAFGQMLSASAPDSEPAASTVSYQWRIGRSSFQGATESTFTVPFEAIGKNISVDVIRSNPGSAVAITRSAPTPTVTQGTFGEPSVYVSGNQIAGSTLRAIPQAGGVSAVASYQWFVNGSAVSGETRSFFRVTSANADDTISVRVRLSRLGYATATVTSASSAP